MIDWGKYFDAIYCINCLSYQRRRRDIELELERVGITEFQNFKFRDTISSIWNDRFLQMLQAYRLTNMQKPGELSLAFGHYYCLCDAIQNGRQKILVLEDDIRFLKDLTLIEEILQAAPSDAELIHFDKFPTEKTAEDFDKYERSHKANDHYATAVDGYQLLSTGCYGLYGDGIRKMRAAYDQVFLCTDNYASKLSMRRYFPFVNLACQVTYQNSMNTLNGKYLWTVHARYKVDRLDYSQYNIKLDDGEEYTFESYIKE